MLTWSATVHTTLSTDTQPTIILSFDDAKYIFNTSENTGRAFPETNGNWKKTKALFFTQSKVEKTSGLAGLLMTFADATIPKLELYGPPGLSHILASSRFYTFRDTVDVQTKEIPWFTPTGHIPSPCYSDTNITVYAIPILPVPSGPYSITPNSNMSSASTTSTEPSSVPAASTSSPPEKRKREPSPKPPRKRIKSGSLAPGRNILSEDLLQNLRKTDFDPLTLSGPIADEYRNLIIKAMFPNTKRHRDLDPETMRIQKRRSVEGVRAKTLGITLPPMDDKSIIDIEVDSHRRPRGSLPNGYNKQLPRFTSDLPLSSYPTMSYLIVGPQYRGKFNAEKANELGVMGRDRCRLTKGETITITVNVGDESIERVIRPEDVIEKSEKASAILLLDVPSPAHIAPLVSSFKGSQFYQKLLMDDNSSSSSDDDDVEIRAIYHLCGDGVLEDDGYKAFINAFCPDTHHIVASRDHLPDPVTFTTAALGQLRLNSVDEKLFPIPNYSLTPKRDLKAIPGLPSNIQPMSSDLRLGLKPYSPPSPNPEISSKDKFHLIASGTEPIPLAPSMENKIRAAKANIKKHLDRDVTFLTDGGSQVGIIPLGTGGALPNKYRNVSSTLITVPKWGNVLLDSGEGTWGQMARIFGSNADYGALQALRDLKCIFISHAHGDHHTGLAYLLAKRKSLSPPPDHPLYIVSIRPVHLILRELSDVQDLGLFDPSGNGVISVISETLHDRATGVYHAGRWQVGGSEPWLDFQTSVENGNKMCEMLGLDYFRTVDVHHGCRAYGCSFKHKDGWSITFSGDTMPTDNLVRIGMNSTVLIHEATMGDDEVDLALKKSHSTIRQAIGIGQKMNAKNILLTHFSARHPKLPPSITTEMLEAGPDAKRLVIPAFDHLNLTIGDMWKMPYYIPLLYHNFRDMIFPEIDEEYPRLTSPVAGLSTTVERKTRVAMTG